MDAAPLPSALSLCQPASRRCWRRRRRSLGCWCDCEGGRTPAGAGAAARRPPPLRLCCGGHKSRSLVLFDWLAKRGERSPPLSLKNGFSLFLASKCSECRDGVIGRKGSSSFPASVRPSVSVIG